MIDLNIVIPMKDPAHSKQRLSSVLSSAERWTLAYELFENCLQFLQIYFPNYPITVVTPSAEILNLAHVYKCYGIEEQQEKGLNAALYQATDWSQSRGFQHQLILPADIADLRVSEIQHLLSYVESKFSVVVVPSKDQGTNALLTSPVGAIPFQYGKKSAQKHQKLAEKAGYHCHMLLLEGLGQDIDMPQDLESLSRLPRHISDYPALVGPQKCGLIKNWQGDINV